MKQQDDTYYVGIADAVTVRRSMLETARSVVQTVARHNRVKDIQEEKLKLRTRLAGLVHDLKQDFHTLETTLPHRDVKVVPPAPKSPEQPKAAPAPVKKPSDHRLDKIEQALNEIEARLKQV